jgi:hypothetical protein
MGLERTGFRTAEDSCTAKALVSRLLGDHSTRCVGVTCDHLAAGHFFARGFVANDPGVSPRLCRVHDSDLAYLAESVKSLARFIFTFLWNAALMRVSGPNLFL